MNKRIDPAPVTAPHVIEPNAVYFPDDVRRLFRLRNSSIRAEKRAGRLRVSKRCGRYFILGAWILEWLAGGLQPSRRPAVPVSSQARPQAREG